MQMMIVSLIKAREEEEEEEGMEEMVSKSRIVVEKHERRGCTLPSQLFLRDEAIQLPLIQYYLCHYTANTFQCYIYNS